MIRGEKGIVTLMRERGMNERKEKVERERDKGIEKNERGRMGM